MTYFRLGTVKMITSRTGELQNKFILVRTVSVKTIAISGHICWLWYGFILWVYFCIMDLPVDKVTVPNRKYVMEGNCSYPPFSAAITAPTSGVYLAILTKFGQLTSCVHEHHPALYVSIFTRSEKQPMYCGFLENSIWNSYPKEGNWKINGG